VEVLSFAVANVRSFVVDAGIGNWLLRHARNHVVSAVLLASTADVSIEQRRCSFFEDGSGGTRIWHCHLMRRVKNRTAWVVPLLCHDLFFLNGNLRMADELAQLL
jgi:hypothetical protein